MEEISKKNTKKILKFCQKYVSRVYIICGDFLLLRRRLLFADLTTKNRALSRTKGSSKEA